MPLKLTDVSRALSHALRHEPWLYELELDEDGWAPLDAVLTALRTENAEWANLAQSDIERMIEASSKRRHELDGERVRALYGHSIPGKLRREVGVPPPILFHSTSPEAALIIERDGLAPMSRQYVHLSVDEATAREVGRRKARAPVLFAVDAQAAQAAAVVFYVGNDKVWLADRVPARFLRVIS